MNAVTATVGLIALPAIVGTAIAILIFLPMSSAFATGRAAEPMFWIAGAVGTLISRKTTSDEQSRSLLGLDGFRDSNTSDSGRKTKWSEDSCLWHKAVERRLIKRTGAKDNVLLKLVS